MKKSTLLNTALSASIAFVAWSGIPAASATQLAATVPASGPVKPKAAAAPTKKAQGKNASAVSPERGSTLGSGGTKAPVRPTGAASTATQ